MKLRNVARFLFWTALVVGVVLGVLRWLLFATWEIPDDDLALSASIAPSLAGGDLVLVAHGLPRTFGSLVRCTDPNNPERWVIGRIAGVHGDTVEVKESTLLVNGKTASGTTACKPATVQIAHPTTGSTIEIRCNMEELGGEEHMRGYAKSSGPSLLIEKKRTVPEGHFFLVSDNRAFPQDSFTFGAVPIETCDARILFRFWSAAGFGDAETRFLWIH